MIYNILAVGDVVGAGGVKPAGTPGGAKNYRSDDGKKKNNKKTIGIVVGVNGRRFY